MLRIIPMLVLCCMTVAAADVSAAESRLGSSAIRQLLAARTVTILLPGRRTPLLLARGGRLRTGDDNHKAAGKWSIDGNQLCLDVTGTSDHRCVAVVRRSEDEKRLFLFTRAGEPSGELILGNETR